MSVHFFIFVFFLKNRTKKLRPRPAAKNLFAISFCFLFSANTFKSSLIITDAAEHQEAFQRAI